MKRYFILFFFLCLSTFLIVPFDQAEGNQHRTVYIIPVKDEIEKGLAAFINRGITAAKDEGAEHIILEMNTPGGSVEAANKIVDLIRNTDIPVTAFINKDAISAGAYISLNADQIVMAPHGSMGAAAVITIEGNAADKKTTSYWLTKMRSSAELNGRDPIYAMAMADDSIDLPEYGAGKVKLLTLTSEQALEVGYAEKIVNSRDELLEFLQLSDAKIKEPQVSLAESIARFITNPIVVPILLSIGSLGLVMELYTPGFGIPGFMGLSALLLFFYGHFIAGLAGFEAIVLLTVGIVAIILELFLPGGILGIIGIAAVITSLLLSTDNMLNMSLSILIAITVTIIGSIVFFKIFGFKKGFFKHIVLTDATTTEKGYVSNENRSDLIGLEGTTLTPLRPAGTALFEDERIDVVTEGGYIEENKKVKIIKVSGSRIIVRELRKEEDEKGE